MRPEKLILIDYLTFEKAEIDFTNIHKALILGIRNNNTASSNGAGKSNLLRSIPWCLWGINPDKKDIDQNVRWGTDFCSVQFDFSHHNEKISVIRTRNSKTGKSNLDLYINGVHSNGNTIAETTKKITEKINLDYNAYINSCYIRQNDINSLANTEDKNQSRELFEKLMGLEIYEDYYDQTKEVYDALEAERNTVFEFIRLNANITSLIDEQKASVEADQKGISEKQQSIAAITSGIEGKQSDYDSMKEAISSKETLVRDHTIAVASLKRWKSELSDLQKKADDADMNYLERVNTLSIRVQEKHGIESEMAEWDEKIAVSKKTKIEMDELDFKIETKRGASELEQKKVNAYDTNIGIIKHEGSRIKAEIESLTAKINNPNLAIGSKCDVCLTDITTDTLDHYAGHLNTDIANKRIQLDGLKAKMEAITPDRNICLDRIRQYQDSIVSQTAEKQSLSKLLVDDVAAAGIKKNLQRHLDDIATKQAELDAMDRHSIMKPWQDAIAQKKQEVTDQQAVVDKLASKLDMSFEQQQQKIAQIKQDIENDRRSISNMEREVYQLNANIEMAKKKLSEFDTINQKLLDSQIKLASLEKELLTAKALLVAFSPKGIRYHIMGKAIEELEKEANEILPKLSQGNLRIRFETKKEIQKSKKGEQEKLVFEAFVNDGEKEQPFSSYSGGEQFRISFVIRVALTNLLLKRANADLQFLVIDEAISPLDQAGLEMIIPTINELQNYFKVILVITHRSEVRHYFDEVITVKRNKYVSRIEA